MWTITSKDGQRWARWDSVNGALVSPGLPDIATGDLRPIEIAPPSGQTYQPRSPGDPTAVFLRALAAVGTNSIVAGTPPVLPKPQTTGDPGEVVF